MKRSSPATSTASPVPGWIRYYLWALLGLAGILALAAACMSFGWAGGVSRFMQEGWGGLAPAIMRNRIVALWHGAFMAVCAAAFLWLFLVAPRPARLVSRAAKWGLVLLVAADALYLSRHYVKTMPLADMAANDIIRLLKADMPERRVAMANQSGFYNLWLTYHFPYHRIRTLNFPQLPRMPVEYRNFLDALGRNPLRIWQLASVGYVLAPAQAWAQIRQDARMSGEFELVYAYNVQQDDMRVTVIPGTQASPGQHVVLRLKRAAPRYALVAGWEKVDDAEALKRLPSDASPLLDTVWVAPECAAGLPALSGHGLAGKVQLKTYAPERAVLAASAEQAAILRIADKYDADWKVWVDGRRVPLLRVDYIFQGVYVEPGLHEVVLRYAPPTWPVWCQGLGVLLCLGAIAGLIVRRIRHGP